ncbi:MAG: general secretion pathway protein GspE, partial [Nitrospinaceae bacterium]|nr:general secretion pathway protein GspE [Nitrospinaceae bacterium]NIR53832.1 general secretion pathway protein GspE [Nitrospinaceae bacterium]NIS84243.1 general secretion pathway protein GspE [Nitrospinaceae bacterium]NIT81047.1 general secretion pathway protein GspE [Nitrospinaceae bacterium]NIU43338.1 general secretion pathway protein GspE [Nitrospinaceae bacterium]
MPQGLILVVGPPGSGKTTTLHALLAQINTPEKKILTAEDPVEIVQSGLRQMPLHPESGLDTFRALDTFRMGTPDVILTTDLADAKTFDLALEVARHQLVLSSVEAESTLDALARTRALGIQEKALGEGLQLIIAQRRVPTLCPHCKEDYHPTRQEFEALAKFYGEDHFPELGVEFSDNLCLKKPAGCKKCIYTGYAETTTLQEVLERSPDLNQKLSEGASIEEIRNQAFQDGMITLNQDG